MENSKSFALLKRANKVIELSKSGYIFSEKELNVIFNIYFDLMDVEDEVNDFLRKAIFTRNELFDLFKSSIKENLQCQNLPQKKS